MLFLTRRAGEKIIIGDEIQIQFLSVSEDAGDVSIRIDAPDSVTVQCRDVDTDATGPKHGPVITHKRRRRS
jgi:carbon storage regulator